MKPFLRSVDRGHLAPIGWVSEPAGIWNGKETEMVYDPRRHQLLRTTGNIGDRSRVALGTAGFRRVAQAHEGELWVRDRTAAAAAARTALDRVQSRATASRVVGLER